MKKYFGFIALLCFLGSITLFSNSQKVFAYQYDTYSTKNYNGVSYQKYWPTSSTTAWQKQAINDQLYRWNTSNGTGVVTPIHVTIAQNQAQSILDYYYSSNGNEGYGVVGVTRMYVGSSIIDFKKQNWSSARITALGAYYNTLTNSQKIETWAHETGHGFGLMHNDDLNYASIMRTAGWTGLNGPTVNDLAGINYLY